MTNWDRRAQQWERAYREALSGCNPSNGGEIEFPEHYVIMTRHMLDPSEASVKTCEIHFEQFSFEGFGMLPCEWANVYASGRLPSSLCPSLTHSLTH